MTAVSANAPQPDDAACRLIALCEDPGNAGAWLAVLRERSAEIARATRARALTVEVVVTGGRRVRIGITPDGEIACPLGGVDPPDALLIGDEDAVARFLLGELPLVDAMECGLLVLRVGEAHDALARLRRLVACELRKMLEGVLGVAALLRRVGRQGHYLAPWSVEASALAGRTVPFVMAAVVAIAAQPAAAATHVSATSGQPAAAPLNRDASLPAKPPMSGGSVGEAVRPPGSRAPDLPSPRPQDGRTVEATASIDRTDDSLHTTVEHGTEDGGPHGTHWDAVDLPWCDHATSSLACSVLGVATGAAAG